MLLKQHTSDKDLAAQSLQQSAVSLAIRANAAVRPIKNFQAGPVRRHIKIRLTLHERRSLSTT
jgi:hypothetical protein